jgi:ACR3 family arsenite transporter
LEGLLAQGAGLIDAALAEPELTHESTAEASLKVAAAKAAATGLFCADAGSGYLLGAALALGCPGTTTLAFTAVGDNFEFAIAVAIVAYGPASGQALAGVVGPLIEVPVLVALVYVSLSLRRRFWSSATGVSKERAGAHE